MRRLGGGAGCGARGRGSQPRTREASGPRPTGITTGAQGACLTAKARLAWVRKRGPGLVWGYGPEPERRSGAPRGGAAVRNGRGAARQPFGAPLPHICEGRNEGAPRAFQKTGAEERWLIRSTAV